MPKRAGRWDRVLRGGSWNNDNRDNLLSSNRNNNTPTNRNNNIGFRCVLAVGGSSGRWREIIGAMWGGRKVCPTRAKKPTNPSGLALEKRGKRRGAGRGR